MKMPKWLRMVIEANQAAVAAHDRAVAEAEEVWGVIVTIRTRSETPPFDMTGEAPIERTATGIVQGIYSISAKDQAKALAESCARHGIWEGNLLYPPSRIVRIVIRRISEPSR